MTAQGAIEMVVEHEQKPLRLGRIAAIAVVLVVLSVALVVLARFPGSGGSRSAVATRPEHTPGDPAPRIELPGKEFDLGTLRNDKKTKHPMPIKNEGDVPLVVTRVATMCGCTKGIIEGKTLTIEPGKQGSITIEFDPKRVHGFSSRKKLTVFSNDPETPRASLDVIAKVDPEFILEPERFEFGKVEKGDRPEIKMMLRQAGDEAFKIKEVKPGARGDDYEVALAERPESEWAQPGKPEYVITARLNPSVPVGQFYDSIVIASTCKRLPIYKCVIHAEVTSFYKVDPVFLTARQRVVAGQRDVCQAVVTGDMPIEITDVKVSGDQLTAEARMGGDERTAKLVVSVKENAKPGLAKENLSFTVKGGGRSVPHSLRVYVGIQK